MSHESSDGKRYSAQEQEAQALMGRLEESRRGGARLTEEEVQALDALGVSDLSGARLEPASRCKVRHIKNFSGAELSAANLSRSNLRGVNFRGAELCETSFNGSDVRDANFSTIKIKGGELNLLEEVAKVPASGIPIHLDADIDRSISACPDAEPRYSAIFYNGEFNYEGNHYGEGVVVKKDGVVLGILKLNVEASFLATRTVVDDKGNVLLWRGGLYEMHYPQLSQLKIMLSLKRKYPRAGTDTIWPVIDIENFVPIAQNRVSVLSSDYGKLPVLRLNLVRFLSDPKMYRKLSEWTKVLESSNNVVTFSN